ncbi:PTS IIA-like nitrogen regulatory protein PtsN [Neisseria shayeganii]|uniref:PTS family porter, EIIA component n=2 Tax=Neisseria shayeganii TaxID=607712 RepID=G4CH07_9NEIS|nr:PTS IIA-like nitrogen regulatory protein PtsN [Neisseria shayeganii]EGY52881.1 PTS family porter, EIIA component [Neisseria shayeganii 871]QMT41051.1 PTS IIA-like nitrogen regulatory protein PtsN [Neisseria shayeganii]
MSLIETILPLSHIVLDLEVGSKKRLFEQVGLLLENEAGLGRAEVFDCLFAREKLGTTALGHGVAIPHGRDAAVQQITGAFVRLKEPLAFDAPDGKPVSLVFVLLVPENSAGSHLEVLAALADKFSVKAVREQLMACETPEAARQILTSE